VSRKQSTGRPAAAQRSELAAKLLRLGQAEIGVDNTNRQAAHRRIAAGGSEAQPELGECRARAPIEPGERRLDAQLLELAVDHEGQDLAAAEERSRPRAGEVEAEAGNERTEQGEEQEDEEQTAHGCEG
jgi:hypothetical protein